jgi:hypothetical protein
MPSSAVFSRTAPFTAILSLGIGLLVVAGCGPPEAGSVNLPESMRRSGRMGYGPAMSKGMSPSLGPGDFRGMAKTGTVKAKRRGGR